ncbi:MAG: glycosyltransferase family 4 protein [Candidatus Magasanikbacteria bacterium CG_4_10_14_0_2_um_filter_37_12]|uniref:Glycosyltransferase family 4 protein n=1 Tax=Candidatus Magasanikbacteria bacterium CG_4_10_14_0_2_um_filter_37_12 TaxID=1974637 RepID=A0A2M7VAC9_9BACT|nr:MAG: glycosyltransferase family 4 protein [Candidatus Magasanikbacteria bacterium CG_4_10_14_0_2_um_filter_37_12]
MKVALVHDYLSQDGGAEQVLKAFHQIWPSAPIFVLFYDKKKISGFQGADIRQSFIAHLPFGKSKYQWYISLMPLANECHNLHDFDVVISSTSAFAKGVLTRPDTLHISYCHTPTRYLWTDTHEYVADLKYNHLVKAFLPRLIHKLRIWDKMSTDRVDYFVANSGTVHSRIKKYYRRESDIIYPPVETNRFYISPDIRDYYVSGGRLVPYKRFDLLIQVFNRLGWPLKIFGTGPEIEQLKKKAKRNIQFLGRVDDKEKAKLLSHAQAFLHPQVEDLGITPIESMASGRPVIAYGVGGVTETVIPGKTGIFFNEQTWESLLDVLINFDYELWDPDYIRNWALRFNADDFKVRMKNYVEEKYTEFVEENNNCRLDVR